MKVLICFFSGTGNTRRIVERYKESFYKLNISVDLYEIGKDDFLINPNKYDIVGIAYPIHAFNAPSIVLDFAKSLPSLKCDKKLFILKTSGEALAINNISSLKLRKILKKKKLVSTNEYHYVMPYNIIFRHSDNMVYKMWQIATLIVDIDVKEIISGKDNKLPYFFMGCFISWVFRLEHWGARFNGKRYKVNDKCIKCKKYIENCPTRNIELINNQFVFKTKCLMCMRCSFYCPIDAISIGLFNRWRVNGPYAFKHELNDKEDVHKNFCKRSYRKYFTRCIKRIEEDGKHK